MQVQFEAHILKKISSILKWFGEGQLDGHKKFILLMLANQLGLRTLEQRSRLLSCTELC